MTCGEKCEDDSEGDVNSERRCNFLCQWFCVKNDYLIKELAALKEYLNRNTNNYFKSEIQIVAPKYIAYITSHIIANE